MAQITEHLLRIPLFAGCSTRDLDRLARATDEVTLSMGTALTRQGDIGREAFVLLSGTAEVQRDGATVAELGPGAVIGELALLDGGPRTATVVATTDVGVIVLNRPAFNAMLDEIPTLAHQLLVTLAHRLRAADADDDTTQLS
ncbi:MAG TPA: cyclic nucleotide-binding domain-containing protein [Microthrixaceae bacterium]|nr:cyclic nucleotide-binding domain-containing protein [Microthrixaceae bacterium]